MHPASGGGSASAVDPGARRPCSFSGATRHHRIYGTGPPSPASDHLLGVAPPVAVTNDRYRPSRSSFLPPPRKILSPLKPRRSYLVWIPRPLGGVPYREPCVLKNLGPILWRPNLGPWEDRIKTEVVWSLRGASCRTGEQCNTRTRDSMQVLQI